MTSIGTAGILGGGQQSGTLIRYATDYGIDIMVMDKEPNKPCTGYDGAFSPGDPSSYNDVMAFGSRVGTISIGTGQVNTEALKVLERAGVRIFPSAATIEVIQDKSMQRAFFKTNGIPFVEDIMTGEYATGIESGRDEDERMYIKRVIPVIISRNEAGTIECYDPVMMIYTRDRIMLDLKLCPTCIDEGHALHVCRLAIRIAEAINLTGMLSIEMYLTEDGKLLVNELAARPNMSNLHTLENSTRSLYDQQLCTVLGLTARQEASLKGSPATDVLEPAALRKDSMLQALRTLLGIEQSPYKYGRAADNPSQQAGYTSIAEHLMNDALAKAVMVRHILKKQDDIFLQTV